MIIWMLNWSKIQTISQWQPQRKDFHLLLPFLPLQLVSHLLMSSHLCLSRALPGPVAAPQPLTADSSTDQAAIGTESTNTGSESNLIKALLPCAKGCFNTQAIISRASHLAGEKAHPQPVCWSRSN